MMTKRDIAHLFGFLVIIFSVFICPFFNLPPETILFYQTILSGLAFFVYLVVRLKFKIDDWLFNLTYFLWFVNFFCHTIMLGTKHVF